MFRRRNMNFSLVILKTRRVILTLIKHRFSGILILFFACSFFTSFVIRKFRGNFDKITLMCNPSMPNPFKDISVPGQIRTVRVKLNGKIPLQSKLKTILLWTKYFSEEYSNDFYFFQSGQKTFKKYGCAFSDCFATSNRSLLPFADAVLFHARDLNFSDIPMRISTEQIWILYSMEPPKYMILKWKLIQTLFNWTMTYRSDADIQVKYGEIVPRKKSCKSLHTSYKNVSERTKGAVWLVSNCKTQSRREAYVKELKKFYDVDIYGGCSRKRRCEPKQSDVCYRLINKYKYYLSFENSICKDYITEKFFNILQYDIVPVVLGGGNYSAIAPERSFIDATNFASPRNLAKYLIKVANNSMWYNSFFKWKEYYSVHLHPWMCDLCKRLHKTKYEVQVLSKDLWSWWVPNALCRRWTKKDGFKNIFSV